MSVRTYLSRVTGDGVTEASAYRGFWHEIFSTRRPRQLAGSINSVGDAYSIVTLEVSPSEHSSLLAEPNVRHIPSVAYGRRNPPLDPRTVGLTELLSRLGLPTRDSRGTEWRSP